MSCPSPQYRFIYGHTDTRAHVQHVFGYPGGAILYVHFGLILPNRNPMPESQIVIVELNPPSAPETDTVLTPPCTQSCFLRYL